MKSSMYLLLALIFFNTYSQDASAVFAFSWYEGHCQNIQKSGGCDPKKQQLWDHQSFTIHGLWPEKNKQNASPVKYGDFDVSIITSDPELLNDMNNYWPPQSRQSTDEYFLWRHEWEQHGHDYAHIIKNVQSHRFAKDDLNWQLQSAFFHDVIEIYKQTKGAQKYPSSTFDKSSLAAVFGIGIDEYTISCVRATTVREIKICGSITKEGFIVKQCSKKLNTACSPRNPQFTLPGWAKSNQIRVIQQSL